MLVISASDLSGLIGEIAQRARSISDHNGDPVVLPTMSDVSLRAAALTALMTATGQVVWPGDQALDLQRKERDDFLKIRS